MREAVNTILYLLKNGYGWRDLPSEFPPWQAIFAYFNNWCAIGLWKMIYDQMHHEWRIQNGRQSPR